MRINNNMAAMNAWRSMSANNANLQKSLEKLSSGFRINRAADDAAGLAVSEKMRAQVRGINMAIRNTQDGVSLLQTAEGGSAQIQDMLQRMRELAVQASSDTLKNEDRAQLQNEFAELAKEINRTSATTKFNGQTLIAGAITTKSLASSSALGGKTLAGITLASDSTLAAGTYSVEVTRALTDYTYTVRDAANVSQGAVTSAGVNEKTINAIGLTLDFTGSTFTDGTTTVSATFTVATATSGGSLSIQTGPDADSSITFSLESLTGVALGLTTNTATDGTIAFAAGFNIQSQTNASTAIGTLDTAIGDVSSARAKMGAYQNRLENTIGTLQVQSENLTAAESRIRDVDMAQEMASFTKFQILGQASTAMLAQANQVTQGILSLLR